MRFMVALGLVLLAAACGGDGGQIEPDARIDAAPGACRYTDEGIRIAGTAPLGQYAVEWICEGGCGGGPNLPAPALTTSTGVTISAGSLTWTGPGGTVEVTPVTADGACWVSAPVEGAGPNDCRSPFRLCMERGELRANPVHWYDKGSDWGMRWSVNRAL